MFRVESIVLSPHDRGERKGEGGNCCHAPRPSVARLLPTTTVTLLLGSHWSAGRAARVPPANHSPATCPETVDQIQIMLQPRAWSPLMSRASNKGPHEGL